jgi:hypothetical protein
MPPRTVIGLPWESRPLARFGEEEHHGVRVDLLQHLGPGLVALAGDRDHPRGHQAVEAAHQGAGGGLLGDGDDPVPGDPPQEVVGADAGEQRLVQAGVVEDGGQTDIPPGFRRHVADELRVDAVEDPGDDLQEEQDEEDDVGAHEPPQEKRSGPFESPGF